MSNIMFIPIFIFIFIIISELLALMLFPGYWNYIKGYGINCLMLELELCKISDDNSNLYLYGQSIMKGKFIFKGPTIFFSYIIQDSNSPKNNYGVLRFSKAHFIIKNKFKELKIIPLDTRIRF